MSKTLCEISNEIEQAMTATSKFDLDLRPTESYSYADYQCKLLKERIEMIENNLKEKQTISIRVGNTAMIIEELTFKNPSLIIFKGYSNNHPCELIQNVNQINILIECIYSEVKHKPIGFHLSECDQINHA